MRMKCCCERASRACLDLLWCAGWGARPSLGLRPTLGSLKSAHAPLAVPLPRPAVPIDVSSLTTRRTLLMAGLAQSLRLPEAPALPARGEGGASDGVFLRLVALPKGKSLLARALRVIYPLPEVHQQLQQQRVTAAQQQQLLLVPNAGVLWALLRNLRFLFSGRPGSIEDAGAAAKVASAAVDVLQQLHSPQAVADALAAVLSGDLAPPPAADVGSEAGSETGAQGAAAAATLPLLAADVPGVDVQLFPWLAHVLTALLQRAADFEMGAAVVPPEGAAEAAAAWKAGFPCLYDAVHAHAAAQLVAAKGAEEREDKVAAARARGLVPVALLLAMLPHVTQEQGAGLRNIVADCDA